MTEHKESSVLARFASPLLILATIIWGSSFVVMKSSVDVLPTFWLLAIRFSFAALVLAVVFTLVNLAVDLAYVFVDPRLKSQLTAKKTKRGQLKKLLAAQGGGAHG